MNTFSLLRFPTSSLQVKPIVTCDGTVVHMKSHLSLCMMRPRSPIADMGMQNGLCVRTTDSKILTHPYSSARPSVSCCSKALFEYTGRTGTSPPTLPLPAGYSGITYL